MIKKIKDKALELILAGYLAFNGIASADDTKPSKPEPVKPVTSVLLSAIAGDDSKVEARTEVVIRKLPLNADLFVVGENRDSKDFYKFRAQALPLKYGFLQAGVVGQHTGITGIDPFNELGFVVRTVGKPTKNSFLKNDIRYFPDTGSFDGYVFGHTKRFFLDTLWKYNTQSNKGFIRPGANINITKNISVGVEGKISGDFKDLQKNYVGIRANLRF